MHYYGSHNLYYFGTVSFSSRALYYYFFGKDGLAIKFITSDENSHTLCFLLLFLHIGVCEYSRKTVITS
jgi:hypothetical protein